MDRGCKTFMKVDKISQEYKAEKLDGRDTGGRENASRAAQPRSCVEERFDWVLQQ